MLTAFLICALLIAADQIIKYLVASSLAPFGAVTLIPGVVEFRYFENDGAAFSILQGRQSLLVIITGIALIAAAVYVLKFHVLKGAWEYLAFVLVFSGGVGNLIDRVMNGYVVDYINLLFMRFAVFNLADTMVCVGFACLVVAVVRHERRAEKKRKAMEACGEDAAVNGPDKNGND